MKNLLLIYTMIILVYSIRWYKINKEETLFRFITMLFIPIFGLVYLVLLDILMAKNPIMKNSVLTLHDLEKDVEGIGYSKTNYYKEINVVSMEEALVFNDSSVKRNMIMDVLKENVDAYLDFLNKALYDSDTETSHYAATAIVEVKRKLTVALQDLAVRYENDRTNLEISIPYAETLKRYLNSGFLDDKNEVKYKYIYSGVLSSILQGDHMKEKYFVDKINCELELGEFFNAQAHCTKFQHLHKNSEAPYLMRLKLYYQLHDYENLKQALNELKGSEIKFSRETMSTVRFWSEVAYEK